jgi:uncharacterized protein YqgC (DUF456 family)
MEILIWSMVILLMLAGLVGSVVPLLPGTTLILLGALLQKWLLPDTISWLAVGWIMGFWALSVLADLGCTLLGTKLFGGGKWGMAGASGGALAGMFFSLPALLLGTMLGAFVAEKWMGRKTDGQALRAGAGAAVGFVLSSFVKLMCAVMMIGFYALAVVSVAKAGATVSV